LSRITVKQETIQGITQRFNYFYDIAGRLKEVKRNDTSQAIYSYDANGNRLARTTPTSVDSGKYDAQDRLLTYSSSHYLYSSTGNLNMKVDTVTGDTTRYTYDAIGNLVNVRLPNGDVIEYIIDASNRRVGKKLNGVIVSRMIYDGDLKPVAELDSAGNITTRYVYAAKENVPEYLIKGGITYRIITDHLGSPRLIVDASNGTVVQKINFDEYGNVTSSYDSLGIPFGFAGGLYDSKTKLVKFGARDYDANTGRWTATDPIGFRGNSANLFSYVGNNPTNLTDPNGNFGITDIFSYTSASVRIGAAIGGGIGLAQGILRGRNLGDIAESTFIGLLSGGISGLGGNGLLPVTCAAGGLFSNAASQYLLEDKEFDWISFAFSGGVGLLLGGAQGLGGLAGDLPSDVVTGVSTGAADYVGQYAINIARSMLKLIEKSKAESQNP
jgi:RHS repeat-associated protein